MLKPQRGASITASKRQGLPRNDTVDEPADGIVPFLKWPGGKQWLVPVLRSLITCGEGQYIEPFLGGAAVFLALRPQRARLSDINGDLVETYIAVRSHPEGIIDRLRRFSFAKECYYRVREAQPKSLIDRAARFIFLNRTCWNGLYRVNRQGSFNVPMGEFAKAPDFVLATRLRQVARALEGVVISCQDFETACAHADVRDTVYLDPPYTMAHNNNGFLRYNEKVFSWNDQLRLATLAKQLSARGCKVIVSNANHPSIRALYSGFHIERLSRLSRVAADSSKRTLITELLITSFDHSLALNARPAK